MAEKVKKTAAAKLLLTASIAASVAFGPGQGHAQTNVFDVMRTIINKSSPPPQQQQQQQQQIAPQAAPQQVAPPPPPMPPEQQAFVTLPPLTMAQIQTQLEQLGYFHGAIDGAYGGQTAQAVKGWQRSQAYPQTGYLSAFEMSHLKEQALARGQGATAIAGASAPAPGTAVRPTDVPNKPGVPPAVSSPKIVPVDQALLVSLRNKNAAVIGLANANALLIGDNRDLVFFFNESNTAPNGVRTLAGDIKFNGNRASVCMLNESAPDTDFLDEIKATIVTKGRTLDNFNFQMLHCTFVAGLPGEASKSAPFDLFAVERRLLTSTDQRLTDAIVLYLKEKVWSIYDTADAMAFRQRQEQLVAEAQQNLSRLRDGKLDGFGMLILQNASRAYCASTGEDKDLLAREAERLDRSIPSAADRHSGPVEIAQAGLEDSFVSVKRERCRYVLGDHQFLSKLLPALERDGIKVSMAPLWIPEADYQSDRKAVEEKHAVAASQNEKQRLADKDAEARLRQETEEQKRDREQQEKLDAARSSADETARRSELERNRKLVETRGLALVDTLNKALRIHLASVTTEITELRKRPLSAGPVAGEEKREAGIKAAQYKKERLSDEYYKTFNDWALARIKEQWEFGDTVAAIEDYGLAKWRSRLIEAISIKVEFPMLNRLIGEKKGECWVFTWINDDEFTMHRSNLISTCAKYPDEFKKWSDANEFKSQWKL